MLNYAMDQQRMMDASDIYIVDSKAADAVTKMLATYPLRRKQVPNRRLIKVLLNKTSVKRYKPVTWCEPDSALIHKMIDSIKQL